MSLNFLINNFTFAFGMVGAIVFIMASWLSFDAYKLRPNAFIFSRALGFGFCAIWYVVEALTLGNDIVSFLSIGLFFIGLLCILSSFLRKNELLLHSIIVVPSFVLLSNNLYGISAILLLSISFLSFKQWKNEQNPTWISFSWGFLLIGLASILNVFVFDGNLASPLSIGHMALELIGFGVLGYWVWQYMRLRIRESIVMLSVGVTFLLATIVTLAFSTILIGRVSAETANNLVTDVKVLDFTISSLKQESLAKSGLIAKEDDIVAALSANDFSSLDLFAEKFLEKYKLGFLTVTDTDGNVLVRANALSRRGDTLTSERAFEEASKNNTFVTIEESSVEGLSIRAGAPVLSKGKIVGVIVAGYQLDNTFVDSMKRLTGLEMFIYKDDTSVSGTAFAVDGTTRLIGIKLSDVGLSSSVLNDGKIVTGNISMYGEPFQASYSPLLNEDGKIVGMLSAAKHQQDIINIANATNRLTLVTVITILLVLLGPIYWFAKRLEKEVIV